MPGDKSISHRALVLGALATGRTTIRGLAPGGDCRSTMACLAALGVDDRRQHAAPTGRVWLVDGRGLGGLTAPDGPLDAGNSGTTARFLMGVLAGHAFAATPDRRRLAQPTADAARGGAAGADGRARRHGRRLPARDGAGGRLRGIMYEMPVPSAQVKSAVLLAGLHAEGVTTVAEPAETRDHTERALTAFGADISIERGRVSVRGRRALKAAEVAVPGDPSSAAFWAAAAAGFRVQRWSSKASA